MICWLKLSIQLGEQIFKELGGGGGVKGVK